MRDPKEVDILRHRFHLLQAELELRCYLLDHPEVTYDDLHDIRMELEDCVGFINDHFRDTNRSKEDNA